MNSIKNLLASCGRTPIAALALATGMAIGLGLAAGAHDGIAPVHPVQEGQEGMGEMDPEAMMQMMAQLGAPDEHHEELHDFVGTWNTKMKALTPGMEAFNSTGKATFEATMGGRFIAQTYHGSMMGQNFKGVGLSGYNKAAKRYESVWHDDMGTAMYFMTGDKTDDGWVYEGKETDPMSGQTYPIRHVITMEGKDKFSFTMQYPPEVAAQMGAQAEDDQKWVDAFRIDYSRAQGGDQGNRDGAGMNRNQGGNRNR
ncbi:hypothetical protein AY599_26505 [Leptolyngbya valderiana BDU 20041]|nr:hypothetical protein AY599_26505 [Leptolyngbya valderiana BDU 20041]